MVQRVAFLLAFLCTSTSFAQETTIMLPSYRQDSALTAYWFPTSAPASDGAPAIIALHGCSGALDSKLTAKWKELAVWFNREGMHLLVLDSFTPRGIKSICEIPNRERTLGEQERREDVFAAIRWLAARRDVDSNRIVIAGWSHGAQTVLKTLDRSDPFVARQPTQPRAAVAYYPGCSATNRTPDYALSAPLLIMAGELDDWTPAKVCVELAERLRAPGINNQTHAGIELIVYPGSYHGFDGTAPVTLRRNVGNTRSGTATVGGNPEARINSRERLFDYLAEKLDRPLRLSHAQRFFTHTQEIPPASGFARYDDANAVPLGDKGRQRYAHFLTLPKPKAFVITEKGGWLMSADNVNAISTAFSYCPQEMTCWLYAVDDRVVWEKERPRRLPVATDGETSHE
jgi:dienelactone hydrolase